MDATAHSISFIFIIAGYHSIALMHMLVYLFTSLGIFILQVLNL